MNTGAFVTQLNIKPADAVILRKKFFGMLDHYAIYLGAQAGEHRFIANYVEGVKIIPPGKIDLLLQDYVPTNLDRFPGSPSERQAAINRAMSKLGEKDYNLVSNNCEHFKNFVHTGKEVSTQVKMFGGALTIGGLGLTLVGIGKKNKTTFVWGIVILIIGILVAAFATREKKKPLNKLN